MGVIELRFLVPTVIAVSFLADVGLRFVPPERIAFRAWEAVRLLPTADGPFTPDMVYRNDRAYGDLPNLGNLPSLRVYRPELFTTDVFGFRRTPVEQNCPVKMIVVGDSFAAGSGLSDSETLSAQLAEMSRSGVYNSGASRSWREVDKLIKRLHLNGGLVVWQISERGEQAGEGVRFEVRILRSLLAEDSPLYKKAYRALRVASRYWLYSPLEIMMTRVFRTVQDDRWLPNVSADKVLRKRLSNGRDMGFLPSEAENFGKVRFENPDSFVQLRASVRATGNEVLVLMVPDKYGAYYPLFVGSPVPPAEESTTLGTLAQRLQVRGVPALDLTRVFRQRATAALRDGRYLYWTDDTHWNPIGVKIAAEEVLKFLRGSTNGWDRPPACPATPPSSP